MSRKRQGKKQPTASPQNPIKTAFTLSAIRMLREALNIVEAHLHSYQHPLPQFALAAETIAGLEIKLDEMLQREEWDKETCFDYNELHILYAAIHMYLVHLSVDKKSPLAVPCLTLCKQLHAIIDQIAPH